MKVGDQIDMATHPLTRSHGVGGTGTVTCIRETDPMNHYFYVIVKSGGSVVLHLKDVAVPMAVKQPRSKR